MFPVRARRLMVFALLLSMGGAFAQGTMPAPTRGKAGHVLVVVWDGMRPDFVTAEHTPTLYGLARRGTFFEQHHPVFVSSTEVNGTALITGAYPNHSGIIANTEYRPELDRFKPVAMEAEATAERGDSLTGGRYIGAPTLTEILQQAGNRTVVAGTKQVALLLDRGNQRASPAAQNSVNLHRGQTIPPSAMAGLILANDGAPFPKIVTYPNVNQDRWTTTALTRGLWKDGAPRFSMLWLSDPDFSQHNSGPGSPTALDALASDDRNLAAVVAELERRRILDDTDIFVVSDHGFSTIDRGVDVAEELKKAGFNAVRRLENPKSGDVLVVGLGGSVSLYVVGRDPAVIGRLREFFQASDFAGVIFSRTPARGTFTLDEVRLNTPQAPDLLVSLRWSAGTNTFGAPGFIVADGGKAGKGTHASLSRFDMHNTLVAAGPDLRAGFRDELPSGNADLAPTILWILGINPPQPMDGRVLAEALSVAGQPTPPFGRKTIEASRTGKTFRWRQTLTFSTVGKAVYFDEGSGESVAK